MFSFSHEIRGTINQNKPVLSLNECLFIINELTIMGIDEYITTVMLLFYSAVLVNLVPMEVCMCVCLVIAYRCCCDCVFVCVSLI